MNTRIWFGVTIGPLFAGLIFAGSEGCTRQADIRDERDDSIIETPPEIDAGGVPVVDSGLETDAFVACMDRPMGDCVGSNDFLCGFEKWMTATAKNCQMSTGCSTNGWLEVSMVFDGCVHEIRMDEPNDAMIACLVAEFGAFKCPCGQIEGSYYFGNSNVGVCPDP